MNLTNYRLLIFDVDGTLSERGSGRLLPGRREFFARLAAEDGPQIALASNQGGVACRLAGWGRKFPSKKAVDRHLYGVAQEIAQAYGRRPKIYVAYNYQKKNGEWLFPNDPDDLRWSRAWRKPRPGMLIQAMEDAGVTAQATLMVGDRDEDQDAAAAADCAFTWAAEVFGEAGGPSQ